MSAVAWLLLATPALLMLIVESTDAYTLPDKGSRTSIRHHGIGTMMNIFQDTQPDAAYFNEDLFDKRSSLNDPVLYMSPRTYNNLHHFIKRGYQSKRYSLNDLIARLRAMVGSDEIRHSGRSSYLRFGAGGKR
ncbi:uncharacterized protein [Argopecten irradians]|uniref:uncharacterized protein isoform X2 n=1 Tax=Argopecten irradians TaxID=31199 RepID=UPI003723F956